jgi:hypothetical protein
MEKKKKTYRFIKLNRYHNSITKGLPRGSPFNLSSGVHQITVRDLTAIFSKYVKSGDVMSPITKQLENALE